MLLKRCLRKQEGGGKPLLSFHRPDSPEFLVSPNLSIPFFNDSEISYYNIYGPCNGLVCIPAKDTIFLCNPALREFKRLPTLIIPCPKDCDFWAVGFGFWFDPNSGAYKVMQISQMGIKQDYYRGREAVNYQIFSLYDSASNSWKHIDAKGVTVSGAPCSQIFCCGCLHWFHGYLDPRILCFDTTTEAFQSLDYPDVFPDSSVQDLMVLDETLALAVYPINWEEPEMIEIWVMKEYGVKESWTKQYVIGPHVVFWTLLVLNNEWLLFESDDGQLAVSALHETSSRDCNSMDCVNPAVLRFTRKV